MGPYTQLRQLLEVHCIINDHDIHHKDICIYYMYIHYRMHGTGLLLSLTNCEVQNSCVHC